MEYLWIVILAALTFGLCFLADKGFAAVFRSRSQHKSGLQVRLRKRVALYGLAMALLAAVCLVFCWGDALFWAGLVLLVMGLGVLCYYLSFGVFYDDEGFFVSGMGKKGRLYAYDQIVAQQLYNSQGSIVVELQLSDGSVVHIQDSMEGAYPFLDFAFDKWRQAKGLEKADCPFHDPEKSCWFPAVEV